MEQMNDDILVKYMLQEANEAERLLVEQWLNKSPANRKYYEDFKLIWEQSKQLEPEINVDVDAAWQKFSEKISNENEHAPRSVALPVYRQSGFRAAAMFAALVGVLTALFFITHTSSPEMLMVASGEKVITDTLPDGSVVTLNKHSTLAYPAVFAADKRQVSLKGEGFFSITPNKAKPFVIDANSTDVTVVGTTFNVKTTTDRTEVIVETGVVEVAHAENTVRIIHNQKAIVTGNAAPVTETNKDGLYTYYRSGEFICNNTPLWKLVSILNEAYNVNITFSDEETGGRVINTTFRNEPIDEILDVICQTLNLKATRNGRDILLTDR